jgi:hypothetical protein
VWSFVCDTIEARNNANVEEKPFETAGRRDDPDPPLHSLNLIRQILYFVGYGEAVVVWSLPANYSAAQHFMPGTESPRVWELTRLWAPDGHDRNLLTGAISEAIRVLKQVEPDIDLVMSYADPSAGHEGFVYRAASWIPVGRSEEVRAWRHRDGGPILPRRAFQSGSKHLNKPEVEALGYVQLKLAGKHRFVRPLSKRARRGRSSLTPSRAMPAWYGLTTAGGQAQRQATARRDLRQRHSPAVVSQQRNGAHSGPAGGLGRATPKISSVWAGNNDFQKARTTEG